MYLYPVARKIPDSPNGFDKKNVWALRENSAAPHPVALSVLRETWLAIKDTEKCPMHAKSVKFVSGKSIPSRS
jgi:hypothetical protein